MARSVNKVTLLGHVGRAPEAHKTKNEKMFVTFSMATNHPRKDPESGDDIEHTEWHRIVVFNERLAEIAEKYLAKGRQVYVEGENQTREYVDREGIKRKVTEVILVGYQAQLIMIGEKSADDDQEAEAA